MSNREAATLEQEVHALRQRVGEMALAGEELAQVVERQFQVVAGLMVTVAGLMEWVALLDPELDSERSRLMKDAAQRLLESARSINPALAAPSGMDGGHR